MRGELPSQEQTTCNGNSRWSSVCLLALIEWNNRGMIRIVCPNEEIGRLCKGAMFAAGLIAPIGRIRVRNIWDAMLLPWKTFGKVKSIRYKTSDNVNDAPIFVQAISGTFRLNKVVSHVEELFKLKWSRASETQLAFWLG